MLRIFILVFSIFLTNLVSGQYDKTGKNELVTSKALLAEDKYDQAIKLLSDYIFQNPVSKEAYYLRALSYSQEHAYQKSLMDLQLLFGLDHQYPQAQLLHGRNLIMTGHFTEALDMLIKASVCDSTSFQSQLCLAHAYLLTGSDDNLVRQHYRKALLLLPDGEAFEQIIFGDLNRFIANEWSVLKIKELKLWLSRMYIEQYRVYNPNNALYAAARQKYRDSLYAEAGAMFEKCAVDELNLENPRFSFIAESFFHAGISYKSNVQRSPATFNFSQAANYFKKNGNLHKLAATLTHLGDIYLSQKVYPQAISSYEAAGRIYKDLGHQDACSGLWYQVAAVYCEKGDFQSSIDKVVIGIKADQDNRNWSGLADKYSLLAKGYQGLGLFNMSLIHLNRALAIKDTSNVQKGSAETLTEMGHTYTCWEKYDQAVQSYQKAYNIYYKFNATRSMAGVLQSMGSAYHAQSLYEKAILQYDRASALYQKDSLLEQFSACQRKCAASLMALGDNDEARRRLYDALALLKDEVHEKTLILELIGDINLEINQPATALDLYQEALDINSKTGQLEKIISSTKRIANYYRYANNIPKALELYGHALALSNQTGMEEEIGDNLCQTALCHLALGNYSEALSNYEVALELFNRLGRKANTSAVLYQMGELFADWKFTDKAWSCFNQALAVANELDLQQQKTTALTYIGDIQLARHQTGLAYETYAKALEIAEEKDYAETKLKLRFKLVQVLNETGQYHEAIAQINRSFRFDRHVTPRPYYPQVLEELNKALYHTQSYDSLLVFANIAIELSQAMSDTLHEAYALYWKGKTLNATGNRQLAATTYQRAATLLGSISPYLTRQVYQDLFVDQLNAGHLDSGLFVLENYRKTVSPVFLSDSTLSAFKEYDLMARLGQEEALIYYFNTLGSIYVIVIRHDVIRSLEVNKKSILTALGMEKMRSLGTSHQGGRYLTQIQDFYSEPGIHNDQLADELFRLMVYEYNLLLRSGDVSATSAAIGAISNLLYNHLVAPINKTLQGVRHLIIVPDGPLYGINFETLATDRNKYLVEHYNISYTESLQHYMILSNRRTQTSRRPLLAVGGVLYEPNLKGSSSTLFHDADINAPDLQQGEITQYLTGRQQRRLSIVYAEMLRKNAGLSEFYQTIGLQAQPYINSLYDIDQLKLLAPEIKTLINTEATIDTIRAMSNSSMLEYDYIFLSLFGSAIDVMPETSVLVCAANEQKDPYLHVKEIKALNLKTRMVMLPELTISPAFESNGQAKNMLANSFYVAGSDGLCFSQWQVADRSESNFNLSMYRLLLKRNMPCAQALSSVKRDFIRNKNWAAPYYWASYVYFGKL